MKHPTQTILGKPVGKKNHYSAATDRNGKAYIYKDPILRKYEEDFARQCGSYRGLMISSTFTLFIGIYTDNKNQDVDNVVTTALDALQQARAITNDRLCRKIVAERRPARGFPRVVFCLETDYEEPTFF